MGTPRASASVDRLETQLSLFARRMEHVARRSVLYQQMDRSGYVLARTLHAIGPASVNQLAEALHLDGSTVTRQIGALAAKGFVGRTVDPDDGRASIIDLTDRGRAEMGTVRSARHHKIDTMLADWDRDDIDRFAELLDRFNRSAAEVGVGG